jgi:hypothetical protein
MKKLLLNNGVDLPVLGLGVYQIEDAEQCAQCVANALAAGYRLIDTAAAYRNEDAVGQGILRSGVARGELRSTGGHVDTREAILSTVLAKTSRPLRPGGDVLLARPRINVPAAAAWSVELDEKNRGGQRPPRCVGG